MIGATLLMQEVARRGLSLGSALLLKELRARELWPQYLERLKFNPNHAPAGSPEGGEFTSGEGGRDISEGGDAPGGGDIDVGVARGMGLRDAEISQLAEWVAQGGRYEAMRSPSTPEGKQFVAILDKLPLHDGVVYRGLVLTQANVDRLQATKELRLTKVSSSSKNPDVAHDFMTNEHDQRIEDNRKGGVMVLMELHTTTGRDIEHVLMPGGPYTEEREVALLPKSRFAITEITHDPSGGYTIKAKQV